MISINWPILLMQIANFLICLFVLIKFVVNPILKVMAKRQAINDGVRSETDGARRVASDKLEDYERRIAKARAEIAQTRDELKQAGEKKSSSIVEAANAEARTIRQEMAAKFAAESAAIRADLDGQVGSYVRLALGKVLGA